MLRVPKFEFARCMKRVVLNLGQSFLLAKVHYSVFRCVECFFFFQGSICSFSEGCVSLCLWSITLVTCLFLCACSLCFKLRFRWCFYHGLRLKAESSATRSESRLRARTYLNPGSNVVGTCFMSAVVGKKPSVWRSPFTE